MPGRANASRAAATLSGARLRFCVERRSGGSDSRSLKNAHARFTTESPAATKHGTAPVRPAIGIPESAPPSAGSEDEPEAERHADQAHAAGAFLGLA